MMEPTMERIDGTDYVIGTPEHSMASREHQLRMDKLYLEAHREAYEQNVRFIRGSKVSHRLDANETAFIARDLLYVRRQIEQTIYEKTRAAEFVPVDTEVPRGAKTYETRRTDLTGEAKISHTLAGDHPRADVSVQADGAPLINVTASYAYDVQDMEYSAFARVPLPRWKALAAAEVIARGLDKVGRIGNADAGIKGFFNNANVPIVILSNGSWAEATADNILKDLQQIEQAAISQSHDVYASDTLVLPTDKEGILTTLRSGTNSDLTVGEYFLKNSRAIKQIKRWVALDDATGTDIATASSPEGILYARDPNVLFWPVPIMFEEEAPEIRGFEWIVNCRARCGGVDVRKPLSMVYIQGM